MGSHAAFAHQRRSQADTARIPSPAEFFGHLVWLDGRPLLEVIEPYRQRIFNEALYSFDAPGRPTYNLVLAGRGKKCWKTADLCLGALYRFLAWPSPQGNDSYILANDESQAGDDLKLAKKIIEANPVLVHEVEVKQKEIARLDGRGVLQILPARDVVGQHGKTFLFVGYDEIHGYRSHDLFEALAPDPTRPDALQWITSYASLYNTAGAPLHDMIKTGKAGTDPRMYFSWYAADFGTDSDFAELETPERRANPSMASWGDDAYLAQQKARLPSHKYRRLHLNLPGMPDGAALSPEHVADAIVSGRKRLPPRPGVSYCAFVDMSGGSADEAVLGIAHKDGDRQVLDLLESQSGMPPFNPRSAIKKFAGLLGEYGLARVVGDAYAGQTFRADFEAHGIRYDVAAKTKSAIYEALEPKLNAGEVELLDIPKLQEQALGLVWRGAKIDHQTGEHDDWVNAAAGAVVAAAAPVFQRRMIHISA